MALYIICGILVLSIVVLLYSLSNTPHSEAKIKKLCIFLNFILIFGCVLFSEEINMTKVSSEKENKYYLDLVDEIYLNSESDLSNIYVYKFESDSSTVETEYMFWIINENGKRLFLKTTNVTLIEKEECVPLVNEHVFEYEYAYERNDFLRAFCASEEPIPVRKKYELVVPIGSVYTIK